MESVLRYTGLVLAALGLSSCAHIAGAAPDSGVEVTFSDRARIIPLADHHQHIFGPTLVDPPTRVPPAITLPTELAEVLRMRTNAATLTSLAALYAPDAQVLNIFFDTDHWVSGEAAIAAVVASHGNNLRFVPLIYSAGDRSAVISGVVHADDEGEYDKHFSLGLTRDPAGSWHIATESITNKVENPFRRPLDARELISRLDDAGIRRAAVLSTAFWLASPRRRLGLINEQEQVQAANDWVIEQTAPYADRLVPFCSVNPLSDYAVAEMRRCAGIRRVRGIKLHFANSQVDLGDAGHLEKVRAFFREANRLRLALVLHRRPHGSDDITYARILIDQVLVEAPDVPIQLAHMGSGSPAIFLEVLDVFADAVNSGRNTNLYFDLTEIVTEATPEEFLPHFTSRLKRIGLNRILFGSDTPLPRYRPFPNQAWATFRRRIPLNNSELEVIAGNSAPYLR